MKKIHWVLVAALWFFVSVLSVISARSALDGKEHPPSYFIASAIVVAIVVLLAYGIMRNFQKYSRARAGKRGDGAR